jgi:hypothetical protein
MTFPDRRLERPLEPPEARSENTQDVVPVSERNQDAYHSTHELVTEGSRPLTDAERKAADRDTGIAEPVFAPASERVPRVVEGYRDVVEHTDTGTPERQAIGQPSTTPASTVDAEPSFTRVPRPSTNPGADNNSSYAEHSGDWSAQSNRWMSNMSSGSAVPFGIGWLTVGICGGIGVWLWMRWQRERNKPINRLRRQAQQARQRAYALRDQMPDVPEEAVRPAMGVGSALLTLAVLLWQQSQRRSRLDETRSQSRELRGRAEKVSREARRRAEKASHQANKAGRRAVETMNDVDWLERLAPLRAFWRERASTTR